MSVRAGIVVTGTEVLSGIIADRNGPWLSERLREHGVQLAHVDVVGDRPEDVRAALEFFAREGLDLAITSGGLGPTADDLTADVVAEFAGRPMAGDPELEARVWGIVEGLRGRFANLDEEALRAGARKQARVPAGATVLDPVGTAPGLVVPPADGRAGPVVVVLPGPPRELQPMWGAALASAPLRSLLAGAAPYEQRIMRLWGIPESEIAATLRALEAGRVPLERLEITTCLRRGEIEIATVFTPDAEADYAAFEEGIRAHHADTLFATAGETIDDLVAADLLGPPVRTVATAESCTGGLLAARLTERAGSSAYVLGGLVVYANEAKGTLADVPPEVIAEHGAVSPEVADALAQGARARLEADVGIGITGIAGPGGGSPAKPVGTVCVSLAASHGRDARTLHLAGDRSDIRERTTTVVMHLLHELLQRA